MLYIYSPPTPQSYGLGAHSLPVSSAWFSPASPRGAELQGHAAAADNILVHPESNRIYIRDIGTFDCFDMYW